jgi:pyridoxal 5'-phosphate synthase pdxS subunit
MQLGAQAVFVGSGIFKSEDPAVRAKAIVEATTHYADAEIVAKVSRGLGDAMKGQAIEELDVKLANRGW